MTKSALRIEACFPAKIALENRIDGDPTAEIVPECTPEFAQNSNNPRLWQVTLNIRFAGKPGTVALHEGEIEFVGLFTVLDHIPDEKMVQLVAVTCPTLLYSSARELIALLTGRGPYRSFLLPSVSFTDGKLAVKADAPTVTSRLPATTLRRSTAARKKS